MSMSIDVLMFDWGVLTDALVEHGCDDREVVEEVLNLYGEKICDKYVMLHTDCYDPDSVYEMCDAMETIFDVEDCIGCIYDLGFNYICNNDVSYDAIDVIASQYNVSNN